MTSSRFTTQAAVLCTLVVLCAGACTATAVSGEDFNCTNPPLSVLFPEPVGVIKCGARSLQKCPIGAVQTQPLVQWNGAESSGFYTVLMVDPDAPTPGAPTLSPIMHWVAVNVPGTTLALGFSNSTRASDVEELFPYHGPHPPVGSAPHRYGLFVFRQPGTSRITFKPLPVSRINWDYEAFLAQYGMTGGKLVSNYMLCSA